MVLCLIVLPCCLALLSQLIFIVKSPFFLFLRNIYSMTCFNKLFLARSCVISFSSLQEQRATFTVLSLSWSYWTFVEGLDALRCAILAATFEYFHQVVLLTVQHYKRAFSLLSFVPLLIFLVLIKQYVFFCDARHRRYAVFGFLVSLSILINEFFRHGEN